MSGPLYNNLGGEADSFFFFLGGGGVPCAPPPTPLDETLDDIKLYHVIYHLEEVFVSCHPVAPRVYPGQLSKW